MRIAVISKPPPSLFPREAQADQLFLASGNNSGNYAFIEAVDRDVLGEKTYFDWDFDPEEINSGFDRVLLVCANMINHEVSLTQLGSRIAKLHLPMSALSIGIQGAYGIENVSDNETTLPFFKMLSEKCVTIGLRGEYALSYLNDRGIHNLRIIGCPSNFITRTSNLFDANVTNSQSLDRVTFHVDEPADYSNKSWLSNVHQILEGKDIVYHVQSPQVYIELATASVDEDIRESRSLILREVFGWDGQGTASRYCRRRLACFFGIDHWMRELARSDFSFGLRLHGNILAMQAGVPALVVVHDARVHELARTLSLPYVTLEQMQHVRSLSTLYEEAIRGIEAYYIARSNLFYEYKELLKENGFNTAF